VKQGSLRLRVALNCMGTTLPNRNNALLSNGDTTLFCARTLLSTPALSTFQWRKPKSLHRLTPVSPSSHGTSQACAIISNTHPGSTNQSPCALNVSSRASLPTTQASQNSPNSHSSARSVPTQSVPSNQPLWRTHMLHNHAMSRCWFYAKTKSDPVRHIAKFREDMCLVDRETLFVHLEGEAET
jgi:hypothetical protein